MMLMTYQVPYVADLDHHVAQLVLCSLAGVAHVSSIFKAGTTWDPAYVVLTALLFVMPLLAFVGEKAFTKRKAKMKLMQTDESQHTQEVISGATDGHMVHVSVDKTRSGTPPPKARSGTPPPLRIDGMRQAPSRERPAVPNIRRP